MQKERAGKEAPLRVGGDNERDGAGGGLGTRRRGREGVSEVLYIR